MEARMIRKYTTHSAKGIANGEKNIAYEYLLDGFSPSILRFKLNIVLYKTKTS